MRAVGSKKNNEKAIRESVYFLFVADYKFL